MCAETPWDCRDNPLIEGGGSRGAYNPTGRNGNPMNTKGSNSPAAIGERKYSAHTVDRMQGRGVPSSAVVIIFAKSSLKNESSRLSRWERYQ